jgi:hypothetical protein
VEAAEAVEVAEAASAGMNETSAGGEGGLAE